MEAERTLPTAKDQDWVEKYRAAIDRSPVPRSRLSRIRGAVAGAQRALFAGMKRIFGTVKGHPRTPESMPVRNGKGKNAERAETAEISRRKAVRRESGRQKSGRRRSARVKKVS
jgi:hypothetical protein